jgi:hypothetical protein
MEGRSVPLAARCAGGNAEGKSVPLPGAGSRRQKSWEKIEFWQSFTMTYLFH